jgi:hypothetical protein
MTISALLRGMSSIVAGLVVRPLRAEHPTARRQDKRRKLRRGRAGEECRHIRHLARGAPARDSLRIRTSPCNLVTTHTSRAATP